MRRRLLATVAALGLAFTGTAAVNVLDAPKASAAVTAVWFVDYGSAKTSNSPAVWSNRVPIWSVGSDPNLTFQRDGKLVDHASWCTNDVCWVSGAANQGPAPYEAYWDSRPGLNRSGDFRIYASNGQINFDVGTSGWALAKMVLWSNACLDIYTADYAGQGWGFPVWANSYSTACSIAL